MGLSTSKYELDVKEHETAEALKTQQKLEESKIFSGIKGLKETIEGSVILPNDEKYHECRRRAFNQNQRGFPLVIVRVKNTSDVSKCVKFIKSYEGINLCIICGGHSSKCMMSDSFIIDLFEIKEVTLNEKDLTVSVGGGAYLGEMDKVLAPHNLGVTTGTYPETGVGGLTLGGGFGWLGKLYGFSVDNFLEAEVVLCNGDVVNASDTVNSDLMWGLRGGSGNFGIVTKFVFKVHKLPTYCLAGRIVYLTPTLASATQVLINFDNLVQEMENETMAICACPAGAPVCPFIWGAFTEKSNPLEIPSIVKGANLGGWLKVENSIKPASYHNDLQRSTTQLVQSGHIYHSLIQIGRSGETLPPSLFEEVLTFTRQSPHSSLDKCTLLFFPLGGAVRESDPSGEKTAVTSSIRSSRYFCIIECYWKPDQDEEGKVQAKNWAKTVVGILKPYSYASLRYASADGSYQDALYKDQAGYSDDNLGKLAKLKFKYDSKNFFNNNVNIVPSDK